MSSVAVTYGFSCPAACGIISDQGLNLCLVIWQVNSLPLDHQGSPNICLCIKKQYRNCIFSNCNDILYVEYWRYLRRNQNKKRKRVKRKKTAAAAKSLRSCPTLCDPIDGSPPASPVPGILQARTQEWVASSFSNAWKWKVKVKSLSLLWLFATPWTAAYQAPPSTGFSRHEYWSGLPLPSPEKERKGCKTIVY